MSVVVKKVTAERMATVRRCESLSTRLAPPLRLAGLGLPEAARAKSRCRPSRPPAKLAAPVINSSAAHISSRLLVP